MSTPLDRGSTVLFCAVCIEAGRATEATHQTRDGLCGCDQHIQQLEQHGRAAVRRQRSAGYTDRGAASARGTTGDRPADSRDQGAGLGDGGAGPSDDALVSVAGITVTVSGTTSVNSLNLTSTSTLDVTGGVKGTRQSVSLGVRYNIN